MFREVTRKKQVLSNEEVVELLKKQLRGVLSVLGDDDYPYGLPINHYYNEEDGCLYFHGGKTGHKIDSIRKHDKVSFCVYDDGYRIGDDWPLHIKSVIVFGKVEFVIVDCDINQISILTTIYDSRKSVEHRHVVSGHHDSSTFL